MSVYSDTCKYRYEVVRIEQTEATADCIDLERGGRFLKLGSLATRSAHKKEDRFVVKVQLD